MPLAAPYRVALATLVLAIGLGIDGFARPARAEDGAGTRSPLTLGSGAREMSMGRTGVATSQGSEALFWNPSRLSLTDRGEFSLFRTQLFADGIGYHAGFLSYPTLDLGSVALGYQRLGVDGIDRRDDRNFSQGEFGSSESHFLLGYAIQPSSWPVAVGGAVRIQQQKVDAAQATGVGLDLGLNWDRRLGSSGDQTFTFGLAAQNLLEPSLQLDQEEVSDPRAWRIGGAWDRRSISSRMQYTVAAEFEIPREAENRWGVGVEVGLDERLQLRGGLDDGQATFGVGLASYGVHFDYAMLDGGDLGRNDRFSLGVQFGGSVQDRREARLEQREADVRGELERLLAEREQQALDNARRDADFAFDNERWSDAAELYRRVLLVDPDDVHAIARLDETQLHQQIHEARSTLDRGEAARAATLYQAVLDRWPSDARALAGLESARRQLRLAENQQRQLSDLFRDALDLFARGDFVGTVRVLDELLRLQPNHELAVELRERAETMRTESGSALVREAKDLADVEQWDRSFARLDRASRVVPERGAEIAALREDFSQRRDRLAEAAAEVERTRELARQRSSAPQPVPQQRALSAERRAALMEAYRDGLSAFQIGDFDRATRVWQQVWEEAPDFQDVADNLVKAYLLQGIQYYGKGDYANATARCRRVLEIEPKHPKAQRYLARIEEERVEIQQIRGD